MKFLSKKVFSLGTIVLFHVFFSMALILVWVIVKRNWDFTMAFFGDESYYIAGGPTRFNIAAVAIGALFKYCHFNQFAFYLFNVFLSTITVIVFFRIACTCLSRKVALYITAIFAFNPELAFYNNFVVKENMLILVVVIAMYFFFKALATNSLGYKIGFCLFLPLITLIREPFILMGFLLFALVAKATRKFMILAGSAITLGLLYMMHDQCITMLESHWNSHIGQYGATKTIFEDMYGTPTSITFSTLFSSPQLLAEYLFRSFLFYIRPGWSAGVKLNTFLVPYTFLVVYVFITSIQYRKYLVPTYRTAYLFIALAVILISLMLIIYDPVERYRYTVYQLGFMLLVLHLKGYQTYAHQKPCLRRQGSEKPQLYHSTQLGFDKL